VEWLKVKALSSSPNTVKERKEERKQKKRKEERKSPQNQRLGLKESLCSVTTSVTVWAQQPEF
jgi:hypothetical protein